MEIDRYIELRRSYSKFVNLIVDSDKNRVGNIMRAGKKLGLLENDRYIRVD